MSTFSFVCGKMLPDYDWPDAGQGTCCEGAALSGPKECTCWLPVFNGDQEPINPLYQRLLAAGLEPTVRPGGMCGNCAYRPDSPEMNNHPDVKGDAAFLERIAARGERFWCHDGMLLIVAWVHPSGVRVELDEVQAGYVPPQEHGIPYRLNGEPGYICAGWNARRKALAAKAAELSTTTWSRHGSSIDRPEAQVPDPLDSESGRKRRRDHRGVPGCGGV